MLKKLFSDVRGAIAPSIPIIALIIISIGALHYGKMAVYQERTVVRDSLDAAVTSALASEAKVKSKSKRYYETLVCVQWHYETCTHSDGSSHERKVCDLYEWQPRQSSSSSYVQLSESRAEAVARQFFEANLRANLKAFRIKNFEFEREYEERYLTVTCDREETPLPSEWWPSDFGDSSPGGFTSSFSEEVRFPRWVKVTLSATVEIPVPMGKMIGLETTEFTWRTSAVKEMK